MPYIYSSHFAGQSVTIGCNTLNTLKFLDFLFGDLHCQTTEAAAHTVETITPLMITQTEIPNTEQKKYSLADENGVLFSGGLDVQFAAVLFDQVIFKLLNHLGNGVALHSGAVIYRGKTVLLPGQSGSGKSTVTAWLCSEHCSCRSSYLTDELIFLPENDAEAIATLTRPLCIKSGSTAAVKAIIQNNTNSQILADEHGAVVPHRLLNPEYFPVSFAPALLIFPVYQLDTPLQIEKISAARTSALLMTCNVNARNLADHGFHQLAELARSIPAYKMIYSSFAQFNEMLPKLFAEMSDSA